MKQISISRGKLKLFAVKYLDWIILLGGFLLMTILIAIATHGFNPNKTPYNQNFINIKDKFKIAWYAVFILTGIGLAAGFGYYEFKRFKLPSDKLTNGLLAIVPISIVCARLFYVIFDPDKSVHYKDFMSVIAIWDGGLAIHGAVIGALVSTIVWSKITKISIWKILDLVVIGFLIGQICGRWGNFINQEANGGLISTDNGVRKLLAPFLEQQMTFTDKSNGVYGLHHPTFLYESFANFIVLVYFMIIRRTRILATGDLFCLYLVWYGVLRGGIIEPMRTDPLKVFGVNVNEIPQMIALTLTAGIITLVRYSLYAKKMLVKEYYYDASSLDFSAVYQNRKIKTILFDFDGTIINTTNIIKQSFIHTFKEVLNKTDLTEEELDSFIGPTLDQTFSRYTNDKETLNSLITTYREINIKLHNRENVSLFPGALRLLKYLRREDYRIGIVSSKKGEVINLGLNLFSLKKYIDLIVSYEDTKKPKPDPEGINFLLDNLGVKCEETIYIGDHENDIIAGNRAHVSTFLVTYSTHFEKAYNEKPHFIINKLSDIIPILERVNYV